MKIVFTDFDPSARICVKNFGSETISCNAHWGRGSRNDFIIHYVLSGEGYFNGQKVCRGQAFLITPGMIHEYHSSQEHPWTYFWVLFSGVDAPALCEKYVRTEENGICVPLQFDARLAELSSRILRHTDHLTQMQALGYFYMLLSCHEPPAPTSENRYVQQAEAYMKTHLYRKVPITEIADVLGINDRYLYNLFIKYRRTAPKQYLNTLRITYAQELLLATDNSVSEIAVSAGFSDVLTFSRFFKTHTGLSPTAFRTRNGADPDITHR